MVTGLALVSDTIGYGPWSVGVGSWLLAVIFLWSGTAKLLRPRAASEAIRNFGVPSRDHPATGALLGGAEVALGVLLASQLVPRAATLAAAAALTLFTLLLARSLLRHDRFSCFCFGSTQESISVKTVGRTFSLAVVGWAAVGLAFGYEEIVTARGTAIEAALALAVVGLSVLAVATRRLLAYERPNYADGSGLEP